MFVTDMIIGVCVLCTLLNDSHLDKVWTVITCFLLMVAVLPRSNEKFDLKITWDMVWLFGIKEDATYYSHLYTRGSSICFIVSASLSGIQTVCSLFTHKKRHLFTLITLSMITITLFQIELFNIVILGELKSKDIMLAIRFISCIYTIMLAFDVDRRLFVILPLIHFKLLLYDDLSLLHFVGAFILWKYFNSEDLLPLSYYKDIDLSNCILPKLKYLMNLLGIYSVIVALCLFVNMHEVFLKLGVGMFCIVLVTVMCSSFLGTLSFIFLSAIFFYVNIHIIMYFLLGRNYDVLPEDCFGPFITLSLICFHSFGENYVTHGIAICLGLYLAVIEFLYVIHTKCEPTLLELGASGRPIIYSFKVIFIFLALLTLPVYAIYKFIGLDVVQNTDIFLKLMVIGNWLTISIEALGSLLVFALLIYDSYRSEPLDMLEDYMYYIRMMTGMCLVGAGMYACFFVLRNIFTLQWKWVNLVILCLNTFVTYQRMTERFGEYKRRKAAVRRLALLADATKEQLESFEDVCAICLRGMTSAKVTPCRHLFHSSCLKKWTYVRETCPLCNKTLDNTQNF